MNRITAILLTDHINFNKLEKYERTVSLRVLAINLVVLVLFSNKLIFYV